jgi:hypothetical protein
LITRLSYLIAVLASSTLCFGFELSEKDVFFVEPMSQFNPNLTNEVCICLDIDYIKLKYPYGMVNALAPEQKPVEPGKRLLIKDEDKLKSIERTTGVKRKEIFTIVTQEGTAYPARVESFAYLGNSPSSIIVVANARVKVKGCDLMLTRARSVALKGSVELDKGSGIKHFPAREIDESLKQRMIRGCTASFRNEKIEYTRVLAAQLDKAEEIEYFVSFWHHPIEEFDLEEFRSACCLLRPKKDAFEQLPLPGNVEPKAVFDLDGDGFGEVFGTAGDAAEVCHVLLTYDGSEFKIIRRGLCAGY